jgi:hypothetical protein
MHRVALLLVVTLFSSACGGYHRAVLRPVPDREAPTAERVKAFKELAPESGLATSYFRNGVYQGTLLDSVMLGDGTRVEDPRDLLPAVDLTSPTAKYVESYEQKLGSAKTWSIVGWSVFAAGLATMLVPLALPHDYSSPYSASPMLVGLGIGGGIELLSLIPIFVSMSHSGGAQADRLSAFETYPRALQKRLALDDEDAPAAKSTQPTQASSKTWADAPVELAFFRRR